MGIEELVEENDIEQAEIDRLFDRAKQKLKQADEFDGKPAGRYVTLRQSNWDYKLIVLQELLGEKRELKIAYYTIQEKALREQGELELQWANRPPAMPPKDFEELVDRAKQEGIIGQGWGWPEV